MKKLSGEQDWHSPSLRILPRNGHARAKTQTCSSFSPAQDELLAQCERELTEAQHTYLKVGKALLTIKLNHLYLKTHDSFELYCKERWGISRFYAYRLMDAVETVATLLTNGNIEAPKTEPQVRPLVGLKPELASRAWQNAVTKSAGGPITSDLVKAAVAKLVPSRETRSIPMGNRHIQLTTDQEVLLKWMDKAKLFIERGYREPALQLLKNIVRSVEQAPDLFLPQSPPENADEEMEHGLAK